MFEDGYFDMIINPPSLMYIPDLSIVFKECYRVMAIGGTFIIMAPNPINYVCDWVEADKGGYYKAVHKMPWCSRGFDESEWIEYGHTMEDTRDKVDRGNRISNDTFETFNKIVESVDIIYQLNDEMNESGEEQKNQLKDIERNMKEISDAVDANAAISEEIAASCDLLNARADELRTAMGAF